MSTAAPCHVARLARVDRTLGLPDGVAVLARGANYVALRIVDAAGAVAAEARADFAIGHGSAVTT